MSPLARPDTGAEGRPSWRGRAGRVFGGALYLACGLVALAAVLGGALYMRLLAGPVDLQDHAARLSDALRSRVGPGWKVAIGATTLELSGPMPALKALNLEIRDPDGVAVVRAPEALVSLDPWSLVAGSVTAREIELRDLQVRAALARDGSLRFVSGEERLPAGASSAPAAAPGGSPVAVALASLLAPMVAPDGVIGALDRATVRGAQVTLVAPDGRNRAVFRRVDAVFGRNGSGDRRVDVALTGPNGPWSIRGRVTEGKFRKAELDVQGIPAADLLLLSGLPPGGAQPDLAVSGRIGATFRGDALLAADARFETAAGRILRARGAPIRVDKLSGHASWNEELRQLDLPEVAISSEGAEVRLAGRLAPAPDAGWRLTVGGRDARIAGIKDGDPAFAIEEIAAEATFRSGAARLDRAVAKGPQLDLEASGAIVQGADGYRLDGALDARRTELRRLIRLWPDGFNPGLRQYLALRIGGGVVDRLSLKSVLNPREFAEILTDTPLGDDSLGLDFAASGVDLAVADDVPPLKGLAVEGRATGARVDLQARSGRIPLPDGRSLDFSDGTYAHAHLDRPDQPAQVAFTVSGRADALAALLATPPLKEAVGLDLDPATVRGRAEIKVRLPLVPRQVATLADMPLSLRAKLTDIQVDKLPGRERLEAGAFALSYEAGALSGRGEARLGGVPATFELASRGKAGELAVSLVLDEAARSRRSLPVAPLLAGPVPVRITVPFASGGGHVARVEVDLGRAAVDGLVPGWTKPANRPGRIGFALTADGGSDTTELRDLAVDAGPVQMRGQATLSQAGGIERAELTSFKLSPGDDARAQIERGPAGLYRIGVKGNVGDVRPFLRWMTSQAGKGGGRDAHDVDVDLAFNILTGHNDEAMTGVGAKASVRSGELRSLQFGGRFRTAAVEAQLAKRDAGAPILSVRSGDAGATLRFLDIYRRMVGGRLAIEGRSGDGVQAGGVTVDEFGLRDEPALRSIVAQAGQQPGSDERGTAPVARSDLDQVPFKRLSADFRRSVSRIDLSEVVIYGAQVGFNLSGFVDYGRDRLDIGGTFVPAYMLNNAFSQLPVVGILLGGSATEGLIAVDFRVAGPIAGPTLTVNPLTAVTPGILRKLFGWMMPDAGDSLSPAPRPSTAAAPPRRDPR